MTDLLTEQNTTAAELKSLFDAAFFDTSLDAEGDLLIRDSFRHFVILKQNRIQFLTVFEVSENATQSERLEYANRMNYEYVMVRVYLSAKGSMIFDCDMCLAGGLTRLNVVQTFRRYTSIVKDMLRDDKDGVLA